jgi:hypothetical protein
MQTTAAALPARSTGRVLVALGNVGLGLTGFALATLFVRAVAPHYELPGASLKLERIAQAAQSERPYDVLVMGPSSTWHAFDPALFDAELARRGHDLRSFNLGLDGMLAAGSLQLIERMADAPPAGVSWILVDGESLDKALRDRKPRDRGVIGWHRPRTTWILSRLAAAAPGSLERRADAVARHIFSGACEVLNAGRATDRLGRWLGSLSPEPEGEILGERRDGFSVFPAPRSAQFFEGSVPWENFARRREELQREEPLTGDVHPAALEFYAHIEAGIRSLGAEPAFVLGPSVYRQRELLEARAMGRVGHILRLDQPARFPSLYHFRARYDKNYLNADGASVYSRELAAIFADLLDERAASGRGG